MASSPRHTIRRSRTLKLGVAGALLIAGLGGGSAYAYFTSNGTGSGAASTGTVAAVTLQAVASGTVSSKLIPGSTADLLVQLNNPNATGVTVVGIAQNIAGTVQVVGGTGCTAGASGVTVPTQTGLTIALGTGTHVLHIPSGAAMSAASATGCQGATFQIPVTVTVQK